MLGETCYPTLESVPEQVDVVDIFQHSERVLPFAQSAIDIGAKVVWLQLGVVNQEVADKVLSAGLTVVQDRCMKIEHARLFGGLNLIGVDTGIISAHRPPTIST